jgi:hypothetical protein
MAGPELEQYNLRLALVAAAPERTAFYLQLVEGHPFWFTRVI